MDDTEHRSYVTFFEGLSTRLNTLKELRSVYDEQMAFNFNATSFFWPSENKTSEILAFFLNPNSNSTHGQKDAFLRVFCETMLPRDRDWDALIGKGVKVKTEHHTSDGRIDILVSFGNGKFLVGIENKIGAVDQPGQLQRYSDDLKKHSQGNYCLLYLNPRGHEPSENSITQPKRTELEDAGKLKIISYDEDIIELFERFIMVCKSDKVTAFLRDFQNYLRIHYTGVWNMDDSKTIKEFITKDGNIELALQVAGNISIVQEPLYKKVQDELKKWADSSNMANPPQVECRKLCEAHQRRSPQFGLLIELRHHEGWTLSMDFQAKNLGSPAVILSGQKDGPVNMAFLDGINAELRYDNRIADAPNIHQYPKDYLASWDSNLTPWMDMATRSDDALYSRFTKRIIDWHDAAYKAIKDKL